MVDSLTWAWATAGSFFDLLPRASQSSCHSSLTQRLKDNWCQWHLFHGYPSWLSALIIKTLWDSTVGRDETADSWSNLLSLSLYLSLVCLCPYVCLCALSLSHSEANYFRVRAGLCGLAALHVWQTASANLHCLRGAPAKHHLALAAVSLRPCAYRVSHHLAMFQVLKWLNWVFC